jgi:FtsP/CotA-like multicopper oxidase with cupredoxin domain
MTTGNPMTMTPPDPYAAPSISSVGGLLETTLIADETPVDMGLGVTVNALTFNGMIPGPTLRLSVNDTVIVRLVNQLEHKTGIHWHGIELENYSDGTPFTQNMVGHHFMSMPPAPPGGTFLYKFKVPRPGIYWYHPHHHSSTNQVFKGLYGMIVVSDPAEAAGVLPTAADTIPLVLSDVTVCKTAGMNDTQTYDTSLTWAWSGAGAYPGQAAPHPVDLCEIPPAGDAMDEHGHPRASSFGAGDIPNIQMHMAVVGVQTNEGQTVLTNGVNVGHRAGTPAAPGLLAAGARTLDVNPGRTLRLEIANVATTRYFRLILTGDPATVGQVTLFRVGGEGGLIDNPVVEGGVIGGFDTEYTAGEILLPAGSRAEVVFTVPTTATGVITLWTQDFPRTGPGFANLPTVPVMHLNVTGAAVSPLPITISTTLRTSATVPLGAPLATPLLDPALFPLPKPGLSTLPITLTTTPGSLGVDGIPGTHDETIPYDFVDHLGSARYVSVGVGDVLQLTVHNTSGAHHPFHLHGFSMQPISLTRTGFPTFTWPYTEFRDNIDIPNGYTLTFKIRIDDRELADGVMMGGAFGRWMFHCHIFFHAHLGMLGEVVATAPDGREKPYVNVGGSWAYAPSGGIATRQGTFSHPDGLVVTLSATMVPAATVTTATPTATVAPTVTAPPTATTPGTWSWTLDTIATGTADGIYYVYITAADPDGRQDQAVFRLKVGPPDDGADNGDPHITTVDGTYYDFQAVGEFTLLHDVEDGMEIQVRQTPVETATPITDGHSGLKACVSVNTAVAARVGHHRLSYQPIPGSPQRLQLFVDGKAADIPAGWVGVHDLKRRQEPVGRAPAGPSAGGIDFGAAVVTEFAAGSGANGIRVDFANGTVLTVTPYFWSSYDIWLLNLNVSRTQADRGIMGAIPAGSWLPALPNGATLGLRPAGLHERYVELYKTFADAWRVTDETSLFVYAAGTSTETFTDRDWPPEQPPCKVKPQFQIPGANPSAVGLDVAVAERVCRPVTVDHLHRGCVFDVATTGDKTLVESYLRAQEVMLNSTAVQVVSDKGQTRPGEPVLFTAIVSATAGGRPTPTGTVTFLIDGVATGRPVRLDGRGRANLKTDGLSAGKHQVQAVYTPGDRYGCFILVWLGLILKALGLDFASSPYRACTSPSLVHTAGS